MSTIPIHKISNTQANYIAEAIGNALSSSDSGMTFCHGAVAVSSGKILGSGFNHDRSKLRGRTLCSFHAEIDTLSRLLRGKQQYNKLPSTTPSTQHKKYRPKG